MASARQRNTPRRQPAAEQTPRRSQAFHRRQEQAKAQREQRRIIIGTIIVLAVVAAIVVGGYLVADYLPRHANVLTVGSQKFDADTVAQRTAFYLTIGDSNSPNLRNSLLADPVLGTLDQITREEVLIQAGSAQVGGVSDADVQVAVRKRIGIPEDDQHNPRYAKMYPTFLDEIPVSKATFEHMQRAAAVLTKLTAKYKDGVTGEGLQLHLLKAQAPDKTQLEQFVAAIANGADFADTAVKLSMAPSKDAVDIGWTPVEAVPNGKDVVGPLQAGKNSDIVQGPDMQWAIYRVVERDEHRAYDDDAKTKIGQARVDAWIESQKTPLGVHRELPADRRTWILTHAQTLVQKIQQKLSAGLQATN